MRTKYSAYATLAVLLLGPGRLAPAAAQTTLPDSLPAHDLPAVVVTATRSPADPRTVPQKIEVLTSEDLARGGAANLSEALRSSTPLDVIEYPGLLTGVSLRGFRPQFTGAASRTLLLVNGRPAGTSNLAVFGTRGVERVEVLRGPASSLYGSHAMGGVVNVITRRTTGSFGGDAMVAYGGFGGYQAAARTGGAVTPALDLDLSLEANGRTRGYRLGSHRTFAGDSLIKTGLQGEITRVPWISPDSVIRFVEYSATSGSGRVGYALAEGWRIDTYAEGFRARGVQNPGDLNVAEWDSRSVKDLTRGSGDLVLSGTLGAHRPTARIYRAQESTDYYDAPEAPHFVSFRTPITTWGTQLQNVTVLRGHTLTVGADYTAAEARSQAFSSTGERLAPYAPDLGVHSAGVVALANLALVPGLSASVGGRWDAISYHVRETPNLGDYPPNTERHSVATPSLGFRFSAPGGVQLYANHAHAFVTPDAFQIAGYHETRPGAERRSVSITRGNPELRPESSRGWDLGIGLFRAPHLEAEVTYFRSDVRDRIGARFLPADGTTLTLAGDTVLSVTTYENVEEALIHGLEGRFSYLLGRVPPGELSAFVSGTRLLAAEERPRGSVAPQRIRNVADLTLVAGVDLLAGPATARLSGRYVGERVDSDYVAWWAPGEVVYPAYLVVDLGATRLLGNRYRLGVDVANLLDENYFEVRGYDLPGRSLRLSLHARF